MDKVCLQTLFSKIINRTDDYQLVSMVTEEEDDLLSKAQRNGFP